MYAIEIDNPLNLHTTDLHLLVGAIVSKQDISILDKRAYESGLTLHALPAGDNWYVTGFDAKHSIGKLMVGDDAQANYKYVIKFGDPLYRVENHDECKRWLWSKIQADSGKELDSLYEIVNAAYVGADVLVVGNNASAIMAAAAYLLSKYTGNTLPILSRNK